MSTLGQRHMNDEAKLVLHKEIIRFTYFRSYLAPLSHSFRIAALSLRILLIWLFPQLTAATILRQDFPLSIRFNTSTRSSSVRILRLPAAAILIMVWISPRFHFSKDAHRREASLFFGYAAAGVDIRLSDTMRISKDIR